jgi:hypothetical protein
MKITAQNGNVVDARAAGLYVDEIRCLFPKASRCVLGKYESSKRAAEVYRELGRHTMFSDDTFVMPQE